MDLVGFDFETFLIEPGLLAPPPVCGSAYDGEDKLLLYPSEALDLLERLLQGSALIAGANFAYDCGVASVARPALLPLIFNKIERGEVVDVEIMMPLDHIAGGHLGQCPNGAPLRGPPLPDGTLGKVSPRYSLGAIHYLLTGENAKGNDSYRLRYGELFGVPFELWPEEAKIYPIDDAVNVRTDAEILMRTGRNLGLIEGKNWTHLTHQTRAAWALHLGCIWGLKVDAERVEKLKETVGAERDASRQYFTERGLIHGADAPKSKIGKDNGKEIKRRVVLAYGGSADAKCSSCTGTGKVPSPKTNNPINCSTCDGTGLVLPDEMPRTDGMGVSTSRDTLEQSGDDLLEEFGEAGVLDKTIETYIPWLESGKNKPLTVRSNVLVATGRASYDDVIQQLPKKGGIRECVIARPGYVLCSIDYNALELAALAQVNLRVSGFSEMAKAINSGKDLHSMLASQMANMPYDDLRALVKAADPTAVNQRFAAKAGNFGFGGLMGAAKFVFTQRKAKAFGGHGSMCRLGGREVLPCGTEKIYKWKGRPCPPVCRQCVEFSDELKKAWLATWPEMVIYFEKITSIPGVNDGVGVMKTPLTGYIRGGLTASSAANQPFQHLAAMGAKHALWKVSKESYCDRSSAMYGSRVILFAHDELFAEIPEAVQHDGAYRMADVMIDAMREFIPDVAIGAEPAIMRRWYKEAKTVHDKNGRLIPWEPN